MTIEFFVPGKPAPGGSKKGFYIKSLHRVVMAPASDKTKPWMGIVSVFAKEAYSGPLLEGPIRLTMKFKLLRPKAHYNKKGVLKANAPKYQTTKPDLTKLERSTEDACTGILWRDDSQVAEKSTEKVYVERDPGVWITIEQLDNTKEP